MRWRTAKDEEGNEIRDEFGDPIKESNGRFVRWSDGRWDKCIVDSKSIGIHYHQTDRD